jgi:hypothetical protein
VTHIACHLIHACKIPNHQLSFKDELIVWFDFHPPLTSNFNKVLGGF